MLKPFMPLIYTGIFALILVVAAPKKEIRRLGIYGIIFGAIFDVLALIFGNLTGLYGYINYGPFGFMNIPFFPPISWSVFFMLYFYFLPKQKPLLYIYVASGIFYSIFFANLITNLGIFRLTHKILDPLIAFSIWIPTATWGYLRLSKTNLNDTLFENKLYKLNKPARFIPSPQPAKKFWLKKPLKGKEKTARGKRK